MLLRLPKPLNLKNSVKEKGVMSVGLLLARCDDGGSQTPWSWVGVGMGHYAAWCHPIHPRLQSQLGTMSLWSRVHMMLLEVSLLPRNSALVPQGAEVSSALANLVVASSHHS